MSDTPTQAKKKEKIWRRRYGGVGFRLVNEYGECIFSVASTCEQMFVVQHYNMAWSQVHNVEYAKTKQERIELKNKVRKYCIDYNLRIV